MGKHARKQEPSTRLLVLFGLIIVLLLGALVWVIADRSESEQTESQDKGYLVETPYLALQYPAEWEQYVLTKSEEDPKTGVYSVTYCCQLEDGRTAQLFTVSFGETGDEVVGSVLCEDGSLMPVSLVVYPLEETLEWEEDDMLLAHEMRSASDKLIAGLEGSKSFQKE